VDDSNWLAQRFDENRSHLRTVAYRMLGSASEADDAVQDAWLRTSRADTHEVDEHVSRRREEVPALQSARLDTLRPCSQ
jgi:DNA-directed RNA polymerase specialized sigma24 family protein